MNGVATRFKKGQSGNPKGRAKLDPEVRAFLEAKTLPALKRLWRVARMGDVPALKVFLAKCLPDMQSLEVDEAPGVTLPEGLTLEELRELARAAREAKAGAAAH